MIYLSSDDEYDFVESRKNSIRYEEEKRQIEERNNQQEIDELNARIGEIDEKLKRLEEKFKDRKVGEFNGYKDLKQPVEQISRDGVVITHEEASQSKKLLFEAVANGDLSQIDLYLETPGLDMETTLYCENLLMCAIRNGRETMAEYLIVKDVNVDYETDLIEFNETQDHSIKYVKYSCRQMAYDHKMWKLVDLIDIFSKSTDKRIVKYLSRRYVNELESFNQEVIETKSLSLLDKKEQISQNGSIKEEDDGNEEENEDEMLKEIEHIKPPSRLGINEDTSESAKKPLVITKEMIERQLREKIIQRVRSLVDLKLLPTDGGEKKCFLYNNFKMNLRVKKKDDSSSIHHPRYRNPNILDLNSSKDVEIEDIVTFSESNKSSVPKKKSTGRKFSFVEQSKKEQTTKNIADFIKIPVYESDENKNSTKYKNIRRKTVKF